MKSLFKTILLLAMTAVMALALVSCDDNNGNGGGGGGSTGYTLADLAGTWVLEVTIGANVETHNLTIDASGKVTMYTTSRCSGTGIATLKPNTFTLSSDGTLRLLNTRFNCNSLGLDVYWVQSYKLKLTSPTTLTGAVVLHQFCDVLASPTCVSVTETWPTTGVKF